MGERKPGGPEITVVPTGLQDFAESSGETSPDSSPFRVSPLEKLQTYLWYFIEDFRYGNWGSIGSSISYVARRKTPGRDRLIRSSLGLFFCRGGTTDFMYAHYAYERRVKEFISAHASNFQVYLDIGSCIGDYSVWLAQRGFRCHAFEPVPENFSVLKKNVELNGLEKKVTLSNFGIGCENRKVRFSIREDNKGASAMDRNASGDGGNIEIRRLDDVAPLLGIDDGDRVLIKIDVEGMELEVLEGGREFISGLRDVIIISEATLSARDALMAALDRIGGFVYLNVDSQNFAAVKFGPVSVGADA